MNTLTLDLQGTDLNEINKEFLAHPKAIALGFFDGVHRGHQEMIRNMVQEAETSGLEAVVMSFDRYPKPIPQNGKLNVIVPGLKKEQEILTSPLRASNREFLGLLQSAEQRDSILEQLGVDTLMLQVFNRANAGMSPEEFCYNILTDLLNTKVLYVGEGYRFARAQEGDVAFLEKWAEDTGVELRVVEGVTYDGELISSTRIREAIVEGDAQTVISLLGRGYTIPGVVIHGQALGRTIDMPTANTRVPEGMVIPRYGVYSSRSRIGDTTYDSITSIGLRPTVNHTDPYPLIETTILDEKIDLYDKYIEVELLEHHRDEEQFPSFIAMAAEIKKDVEKTRNFHRSSEYYYTYTDRNDIPIIISPSQRFNTTYFRVEAFVPYRADEFMANSLLSRILTATTEDFTTRPQLKAYLDSQLAAEITVEDRVISDLQQIRFTLSLVNRGPEETETLIETSKLFMNMMINPAWDEFYNFPEEVVTVEKNNLIFDLNHARLSTKNEAINSALVSLHEKNKLNAVSKLTTEEQIAAVERVSNVDLQQAWMRMFSQGHLRVYLAGRFEDKSFANFVADELEKLPRNRDALQLLPGKGPHLSKFENLGQAVGYGNSRQESVILIYSNLPRPISTKLVDVTIFDSLFAGRAKSLLNLAIMEELGYYYDVSSRFDTFNGLLIVHVEVEQGDRLRAIEVINQVIQDIAEGNYSDSDFLSAFRYVENILAATQDDAGARLDFASLQKISGDKYSPSEALIYAKAVTKESLSKIAKQLSLILDYSYLPESLRPETIETAEEEGLE